MNKSLKDFIGLIYLFVNREISGEQFQEKYLQYFLRENPYEEGSVYEILNDVFWDVEDFVSDSNLLDDGDIDELELRKRCDINLNLLNKILFSP